MMQSGILYYPKTLNEAPAFIFEGLQNNSGLVFVDDFTLQPKSLIRKIAKFLLVGRVHLNGRMLEKITGYKGWQMLEMLRDNDRLLVNGVTNLHTLRAVTFITPPTVKRFQYFNNCLRFVLPPNQVAKKVMKMQQMGYILVTFDPQEAKEYQMKYAPQFYRFPDKWKSEIKYDFFFCGVKKDRGNRLEQLKAQLESMGFSCLFIIVGKDGDKRISYEEYIGYVKESRCLVDMFQEGQIGLTRRPMEALFFNKKLLTENVNIKEFDFYKPSNVFVRGNDDWKHLLEFMNMPYSNVEVEIKQKYDVNQWIRTFD